MIGRIYKLIDPFNNEVLYIGCTTNKLQNRLRSHLNDMEKGSQSPIYQYLRNNNIIPLIVLVEEIKFNKRGTLFKKEKYWISQFRNDKLQNQSSFVLIKKQVVELRRRKFGISAISRIVNLDNRYVLQILKIG